MDEKTLVVESAPTLPDGPVPGQPCGLDKAVAEIQVVARPSRAMRDESDLTVSASNTKRSSQKREPVTYLHITRALHNALRGHYVRIVLLGLVTGVLGVALGWKASHPIYRSEGLVRIAYTLPEVIQETDQNKPLLMFETFMQSQRLLIRSRRVIDQAILDPLWKTTAHGAPADPTDYFARNLLVEVKPHSEFILIAVTDADPGTAAAAVNSIINAYSDQYTTADRLIERNRTAVLEGRQTTLQSEIQRLTTQVDSKAKEWGTTNLAKFFDESQARVTKLEGALSDVRLALAEAHFQPKDAEKGAGAKLPSMGPPSPERIAATDSTMRGYVDEQVKREGELQRLYHIGCTESNQRVVMAKLTLEDAKARIGKYLHTYLEVNQGKIPVAVEAPNPAGVLPQKSVEELRGSETLLIKLCEDAKAQMLKIGSDQLEIQQVQGQLAAYGEEHARLTKRIDTLKAEGQLGGRLSIVAAGEIPLTPDKDPRIRLAAVVGAGSMFVPTGLLLFWSAIRRRYRFSDETVGDMAPKFPLLGILPIMTDKLGPEESAEAALTVHQIRVALQAQGRRSGSSVYLVTSTTAGEGKTSLVMSLALSFNITKLRTLVMDGDIVGRRLTTNLGRTEAAGLHEALIAGSLKEFVLQISPGLFVLSSGGAGASEACALSTEAIRKLLAEARQAYDIVLIDTGPILGSVEAGVLAQEVDDVVFMINRGQQRGHVERALERLHTLSASVSGFIFNRATPGDFHGSPYSCNSVARSTPSDVRVRPRRKADLQPLIGFGPLVRAVASWMPVPPNQNPEPTRTEERRGSEERRLS